MKGSRLIPALLMVLATGISLLPSGRALAQGVAGLPVAAPDAPFESQARQYSIAEFKGHKVMLWLLSTWCPSCSVGMQALVEKQPQLQQAGLTILALKNYQNGGYPGPSMDAFVEQFGGSLRQAPNWIFGDASQKLAAEYNARNYPDIYFLIDEQGMVQAVNGAPSATLDTIMSFAAGK
jgi:thiol-disulfide isomerase/thioredoxin